jgi:transposase
LTVWLASLPSGSRIGMEATGCYHELLADLAHRSGHTVFVLNPKDTRHYAQAVGLRAKTDRVDALLIARLIFTPISRPLANSGNSGDCCDAAPSWSN